jgi:tetratricopeptide (TPR) repeat protein
MSKKSETIKKTGNTKKIVAVVLAVLIFVSVSAVIFLSNESESRKGKQADQTSEGSTSKTALEYDKEARKMLEPLAIEMAKDVSPYKFILPGIQKVEELTWNALDIDSTLTTAWERLGYIYAQMHGKQSVLRYKSFLKQGKKELVAEEKENILVNFAKANLYYDKALEFGCSDSANIYYQKAAAAGLQMLQYYVAENMLKAHEVEPQNRKYEAKLIEAYMQLGDFDKALAQNEIYMKKYPESDIPYLNLGGYYYFKGDTATAMGYYQQAADMGSKPEVGKLLHKYYMDHGYPDRAEYYLQKAYEAHSTYDPEKY